MPSWAIHLNVAKQLSKNMNESEKQKFILGNILPDVNNGYLINPISEKIPYSITHYSKMQTFDDKTWELSDYKKFIKDYNKIIKEPIILGYLAHLATDFYWNYNTYVQKGIFKENKLVGIEGKNRRFLADKECLRIIKVNDFNLFSQYLYKNKLIPMPKFSEDLLEETQKIKQIHIEKQDLMGINQYFYMTEEKEKVENNEYQIYTLEEMEECTNENIQFIEKIFKNIE